MAILLSGTGSLPSRLGLIIGNVRNCNGFLGNSSPVPTSNWGSGGPKIQCIGTAVDAIQDQYESALQGTVDSLYGQRDSVRTSLNAFKSHLRTMAENTLINMADADTPLTAKTVAAAVKLLYDQMVTNSNTVTKNTTSISVAAASGNTGNATVVASVIGANGKTMEYIYDEALTLTITSDSQTGGTAGSESASLLGEVANNDMLDWNWPLGSGASATLTMVDPTEDAGKNLLTNSDFEAFTSNVPDKWSVLVGTAGTDIKKDLSNTYDSSGASLNFVGDGSTLSSITQTFNSSTGTTSTLKPNTVYAVNAYVKMDSTPAAGVLAFDLIDGSNVIINDDNSAANTITKALTGVSTTYVAANGFFRTPKALAATIKIRVRLSTALTSGRNAYIDHLAMCEATQAYTGENGNVGGPWVAIFRGSTEVIKKDNWTITAVNDYAGKLTTGLWRIFNLPQIGYQIPSDSSGTISDNLVTA